MKRASTLALACAALGALLSACQQPDSIDQEHVLLNVEADSAYSTFDILYVAAVNGTDTTILFNKSLSSPDQLRHLRLDHAPGGTVHLLIRGERNGVLVYEQERVYDIGAKSLVSGDVNLDIAHNISRPPVIKLVSVDTPVAAGDTLRLRALIDDPDGTVSSYAWYFEGDAAPSKTASPGAAHVDAAGKWVYAQEGPHDVALTALDNTGRTARLSLTVRVDKSGLPRAQLAFVDTTISIGDTLSIRGAVSDPDGVVHGYAWDYLGGGSFGADVIIDKALENVTGSHVYPDTGTFWATLRAVDNGGRVGLGKARVRVVRDLPHASAGGPRTVLTGSAVTLQGSAHDSLGRIASYAWKIGDSAYVSATGPQISFTAPAQEATLRAVLKVVDDDGNIVTDTAVVTVVFPSEALLSMLRPSLGSFSPPFDRLTLKYSDTVAFGTDSLTIFLRAENTGSSIAVGGKAVPKGDSAVRVSAKTTPILVDVTSPDGKDHKQYRVDFSFRKSGDPSLKSLGVSAGKLDPDFKPDVTVYALALDSTATTLSLTPVVNDPTATLLIGGKPAKSGEVTEPLPLSGAFDTLFVQVTAQDGSPRTYEVQISRALASGTDLKDLRTSAGDLQFSPYYHNYRLNVGLDVMTATFTPTLKDTLATLKLGGKITPSGLATPVDTLQDGDNLFIFTVKAQNGDTAQYTVHIVRSGNQDPTVGKIVLSLFSQSAPQRDTDITSSLQGGLFIDTVEFGDTSFIAKINSYDPKSEVTFESKPLTLGATGAYPLELGDNTFSFVVTPEEKAYASTYTLIVHRRKGLSRMYGGLDNRVARKILLSKKGGFILVGEAYPVSGSGGGAFVIRTDSLGDTLWTRSYETEGMIEAISAQEFPNGDILLAGKCISPVVASEGAACLVRTDPQGAVQWMKKMPRAHGTDIWDLQPTGDGGFVVTGECGQGPGPYDYDLFAARTNSSGDTLWTRVYAAPRWEGGRSVTPANGGFFLLGYDRTIGGSDTINASLTRIDENGTFINSRTLAVGDAWTIRRVNDGGFAVTVMNTGDNDAHLFMLDSAGKTAWTQHYGGMGYEFATDIQQTADGGFIMSGSYRDGPGAVSSIYLLKVNGLGTEQWSRTLDGPGSIQGMSVTEIPGGYAALGYGYLAGTTRNGFFLVKTDSQGNYK